MDAGVPADDDLPHANAGADAHLAALAIEHGATLGSFDRDFIRCEAFRFEHLQA